MEGVGITNMDNHTRKTSRIHKGHLPTKRLRAIILGKKDYMDTGRHVYDETVSLLFQGKPITTGRTTTAMSSLAVTYYCDDAAERIAEMIEDEEVKKRNAQRTRDYHRSDTSIRAFKQALGIVLLEQKCRTDGEQHHMPDVDAYLAGRTPAA